VEPARLPGDTWSSGPFEFAPECLDALIDFIDGVSERVHVIEPLTLQLVCRQAEEIAQARQTKDPPEPGPVLTLDDFGGPAGLARVVRTHFTTEISRLRGAATQRRAVEMFERGLIDPEGKRLMLEQGEIERDYRLDAAALDALVAGRLLRREPRNESIFYEISHDRLTEAIAKNRRTRLPAWVLPTIAVAAAFIVMLAVFVVYLARARQAESRAHDAESRARTRAERASELLLGEDLVSRLREAGLSDALKRVLEKVALESSSNSLAAALKLRHEGDIERERGTVNAAQKKFTQALALLDPSRAGSDRRATLLAERARTLTRLGYLSIDRGELTAAEPLYGDAVKAWDEVLRRRPEPQQILDAADTRMQLGELLRRLGEMERAESEFAEAAHITHGVLLAAYTRMASDGAGGAFELGRAMKVYADATLGLANLWYDLPPKAAAHALAREAVRLRPLSFESRILLGTAAALHGGTAATVTPGRHREIFEESSVQFVDLTQFDPEHRRMQRERAALQVVIADGEAACARTPDCARTLPPASLLEAAASTLDSIGTFRWLAGLDPDNRELIADIGWGLETRARLLGALGRPGDGIALLSDAIEMRRRAVVDARNIEGTLSVAYAILEKVRLLAMNGAPAVALAELEAGEQVLASLPQDRVLVMVAQWNFATEKNPLLRKLGRRADAERLARDTDALAARIGTPWETRKNRALAFNAEGNRLHASAHTLTGTAAIDGYRRAADQYELAIREYPLDAVFWGNLKGSQERIAFVAGTVDTQQASRPAGGADDAKCTPATGPAYAPVREAALRGALTSAWMARVLSSTAQAGEPKAQYSARHAKAWEAQYSARRSLAQFLREQCRSSEAVPLVAQGVQDATEYAHQRPGSADALFVLADANVGLGLLRNDAGIQGWEDALRRGLAYGERLAQQRPMTAERWQWVADFRQELGRLLQEKRPAPDASTEFGLARAACTKALQVAGTNAAAITRARECLASTPAAPER
jgi:tetratricopeptide (TPR) repeat protein